MLCGEPSFAINDILRKLYDEAKNMVKLKIFARNHIIPNQRLVFTPRMRDLLFIMVCRHIAYGGTINKILPLNKKSKIYLRTLLSYSNAFMDCLPLSASPLSHIMRSMILIRFQRIMRTIVSATSAAVLICSTGFQLSKLVNIPDFTVPTVFFESPNQFLLPSRLVKFIPTQCSSWRILDRCNR